MKKYKFWETEKLNNLNKRKWEMLCDGCAKCCLHKAEDVENKKFYQTDLACKLLDINTGKCKDYENRHKYVPDCVKLSAQNVKKLDWLPKTCSYRLISEGEKLPHWHHLICNSVNEIHNANASIKGRVISEKNVENIEAYILEYIKKKYKIELQNT